MKLKMKLKMKILIQYLVNQIPKAVKIIKEKV